MEAAKSSMDQLVKKRRGRPPGRQYDRTIHVRVPGPALAALTELAELEHMSVAELMRSGLMASLAGAVELLVKIVNNDNRCPRRRLKAIRRLRLISRAALFLGPTGLQMARIEAAKSMTPQE